MGEDEGKKGESSITSSTGKRNNVKHGKNGGNDDSATKNLCMQCLDETSVDDGASCSDHSSHGIVGASAGRAIGLKHTTSATTAPTANNKRQIEKAVFSKARQLLDMGKMYRSVVYIYAERKLLVFFGIHFMATMIIWAHFGLIKFEQQGESVPEGAPRYWWKRLTPTFEFAAMHAILFQMALIPLTMSRYSIAWLSRSECFIDKFVPLNRMLRIHIHLGYTMILIVFLAVIFFFTFFGLLCSDGDQSFCDKFKSEIMITGYVILVMLLIVGFTSFFRHKIPYEVFYVVHHIVFAMFILTIVHTIDVEQRKGLKERSQTFKWFSSTLLYYIADRCYMHLTQRYKTKLLGSSVVYGEGGGTKMVILKIARPTLFHFKPGQYAFLRIPEIDAYHWHPFSIASGPESSKLEFYIEVYGKNSWTGKLLKILNHDGATNSGKLRLFVDVMGPYGTSLGKTDDYSHIMAIGAGTGVVPILSLFKQHIRHLLQLQPDVHFKLLRKRDEIMEQMELAEEARKGSIISQFRNGCSRRYDEDDHELNSVMMMSSSSKHERNSLLSRTKRDWIHTSVRSRMAKHDELSDMTFTPNGSRPQEKEKRRNLMELYDAVFLATQSIYGTVLLTAMPIMGVTLLGLTISWNCIPIKLHDGMTDGLKFVTGVFQCFYAIVSLCIWNANSLLSYIDLIMCLITPFADWYWFGVYNTSGVLRPADIATYTLVLGYMTARVWTRAVVSRNKRFTDGAMGSAAKTDKFEFIWVTRSASQVSEILPDVLLYWDALVEAWGVENAKRVCNVSVYVTDRDRVACEKLYKEFASTCMVKNGRLSFHRPSFMELIENHTVDVVCSRRNSSSLLAFCGSPTLATEIHSMKISNDMVTAITGNKRHQMEFISESYGGKKASRAKTIGADSTGCHSSSEAEECGATPLTTRTDREYFFDERSNGKDLSRRWSVNAFVPKK